MRIGEGGFVEVLTRREQETIHRNVLRILSEVGLEVGSERMLGVLADFGAEIDLGAHRAKFAVSLVEDFLSRCPKIDWSQRRPGLQIRCSTYFSRYHVPGTDCIEPLTEAKAADLFRTAQALAVVDGCMMTGCPWNPRREVEPLWERFYAWKFGAGCSGTLFPTEANPALYELYETYAGLKGVSIQEVFSGSVYMQSPLRLGAEEARQFLFWWERGCRVWIGHMTTGGTTAPVTLAGLVTQTLAENLALALLQAAFYGDFSWSPSMMASVADMRTLMRSYGAPEMALANMMGASMARFYGLPYFGHSGCTDAKLPSAEAAAHKLLSVLPTVLAGGDAFIDAGLLSVDEVVSPVQLILDAELGGALRHMLRQFEVSDETIGFDAIRDVASSGLFISHEHTLRWFRQELWHPRIWSREMLDSWQKSGCKLDADRALDLYREISATQTLPQHLAEDEERALLEVIRRAESSLGS